jgi:hypothetical protein
LLYYNQGKGKQPKEEEKMTREEIKNLEELQMEWAWLAQGYEVE